MSNRNNVKNVFHFSTSKERKEFLQERLDDGHEFRRKFDILLLGFGAVWLVGDILFLTEGSITLRYYLLRLSGIIIGVISYLICTRIAWCARQFKKMNSFIYDTLFLVVWIILTTILGGLTLKNTVANLDSSGISGYFSAGNLWIPLFFAFFFFKSFIVYWGHKIAYLAFFVLGFIGFRIEYAPLPSSLVVECGCAILISIIIILDEWSHRITFLNKKQNREKINLFEATLERIQELIIVLNERMEIKYSNFNQGNLPKDSIEEFSMSKTGAKLSESLLRSIKCLRFSDISSSKEKIPLKIRNSLLCVHEGYSFADWIQKVWSDNDLNHELHEQKFITLQGKVKGEEAIDETTESPSEQFFTIQVFAKLYDNQECLVAILKDITEHVVILQERNEMQSNLLSSLSHELNTPLGISQSLLENATRDKNSPTYIIQTYLEPALNYSRWLKLFINDVLDFVNIQKNNLTLNLRVICVESILTELANLVSSSIKQKQLSFHANYDRSRRTILKTDPERLKQVVKNLLVNAIKYTMKGGITLTLLPKPEGSGCTIKVSDTGIGITEKECTVLESKLKKSNFCTLVNKNTTGAGIGLIVSHAITKSLNPSSPENGLRIESEYGIGTTFTLDVENQAYQLEPLPDELPYPDSEPYLEEDTIEPLQAFTPLSIQTRASLLSKIHLKLTGPKSFDNKTLINQLELTNNISSNMLLLDQILLKHDEGCRCKKLLVVDDEVFNTVATEMIGRSLGYTTEAAFNGRQGIEKIEKRVQEVCGPNCKLYNLVIMDCNMPIMDGYAATEAIREKIRNGEVPKLIIVGCTAYEGADKLEQCIKSGMSTYVKKPLDKGKLQALLKQYDSVN